MADTAHHRPRVLVTGASIAGPALAWGLTREGFDVTLLERSAEQRQAGQNIDVRGLGRDVLRRMGIEDAVMANLTGEDGTRFVDEDGRVLASFPAPPGRTGRRRRWRSCAAGSRGSSSTSSGTTSSSATATS